MKYVNKIDVLGSLLTSFSLLFSFIANYLCEGEVMEIFLVLLRTLLLSIKSIITITVKLKGRSGEMLDKNGRVKEMIEK